MTTHTTHMTAHMTTTHMTTALAADVTDLVRESLGDPLADIARRYVEPVGHDTTSISTTGLHRVRGTTTDGRPWSFFVKSIHSLKHWPLIGTVPAPVRAEIIARFPWRADADTYLAGPPLPEGLRLPRLYRVDDLGDDRLVLWLEDVRTAPAAWDLDRYRRAAGLLGALAAMRPATGPPDGPGTPPDPGLRVYCAGPVQHFLSILRDPATWRHPLVARYADDLLRADLLALGDRIGPLLAAVERLPHALGHGDASPQNLLVPADGSAQFVAVDWGWGCPAAIGFDLGQLLVGLAHAGLTEPAELPAIHEAIEPAYAAEVDAAPDQVAFGYAATLVLRNAWTALPLDHLEEQPTPRLHELFRKRAGLARFIADLGRSLTS
ncbi:phosphotransferase [Planobispora takensis]|uniref:Uncharacterized protein n=1 Tax=Planobispora takensis TaxID=1367882 RepID=A0A8J3SXK3_9ACTN|nr:phosphotransferase [Planobispora takensis]GII02474.1 hypothetical protein Pta02_44820 [Planobispora takensis]